MNGNKSTIDVIVSVLNSKGANPEVEIVVAQPAPYLDYVRKNLDTSIAVAAQNCYKVSIGAFTGEISAEMIKDTGCGWVILGQAERRKIFGESYQSKNQRQALFALVRGEYFFRLKQLAMRNVLAQ